MTTRDAIGMLSYFARKIDFAAEMGKVAASFEEGEAIKIIGARDFRSKTATAGRSSPPVLPQLKREHYRNRETCGHP